MSSPRGGTSPAVHVTTSFDGSLAPLLAEMSWLRRLARELASDPHAADDAVQETLSAALEHRPDAGRPARGWLATVLRNALRQGRRGSARRAGRERAAARPEGQPSTDDLAVTVELQRELAGAVLSLSEPSRSALLLRFFEGLPPRAIARRQGVSVAAVRSRIQRGLAELRERLDREHGRRAWLAALAPLARRGGPVTGAATSIGVLLMSAKTLTLCAAVAAAVVVAVLATGGAPERTSPLAAGSGARAGAEAVHAPPAVEPPEAPERAAVEVLPPAEPVAAAAPPPAPVLEGFALDASGDPLPAVHVRASDGGEIARTDARGRFAFGGRRPQGWIELHEPGWTTVLRGSASAVARASVVVGARAVTLAGRVVDEGGAGVPGARLVLELPDGFRGRFPTIVDDSTEAGREESADATGAFELAGLPAVEGATIAVTAEGFAQADVPLPPAGDPALTVVLRRPARSADAVRGVVVDGSARPVEDALVAWGLASTRTDARGRFELDARRGAPEPDDSPFEARLKREITALRSGYLPGRVRSTGTDRDGRAQWPEPLVVQLGGPPLEIRGRVEDAAGSPLPDVRVWVNGLTFLGARSEPRWGGDSQLVYVENELRGAEPGWSPVRTDERGEFALTGLLPRSYHLTALDETTAARADLVEVPAGSTEVVLRFAEDALVPEVRGRAVDRSGRGLPHVHVQVVTNAYEQEYAGVATGVWSTSGAAAETDAEGRFVLRGVPRERAYLSFSGEEVLAATLGEDEPDWVLRDELEIALVRRCHFRVELGDPSLGDQIGLLDGDGGALELVEFHGNGTVSSPRMQLHDGRSSALAASEDARTLVVYRDREEVLRAPVELLAGELTVLTP